MGISRRGRVVVSLVLVAFAVGLVSGLREPATALEVNGVPDDVISAEALRDLEFRAAVDDGDLTEATLELNGRDITGHASINDGELIYRPEAIDDGDHELVVRVPSGFPSRSVRHTWEFTVDATPPELAIEEQEEAVFGNEAVDLVGQTEPEATVSVAGTEVAVGADGSFSHTFEQPPNDPVDVVAMDAAGNETTEAVEFDVLASRVDVDEVRSLHVTAHAWASDTLREPILEMAEEGRITSVQLDLKDESGHVGYDSSNERAREIGAAQDIFVLEDAIQELHERGIYVIGRVVAFRDPVLADYAWENDQRDQVLQTPDGGQYAGYGGFTNFAHPEVRQYNIDIAKEGAAAGVDDILYDYIRRPDGPIENLEIPGLGDDTTPEEAIVEFMAKSREQLEPYRVSHGASVYGIAATRATQIAQDIPGLAEHSDYIAPMLYPSHWGPGEYDVANPNAEPYEIIYRSLADFQDIVEGTDVKIIPWLQDFSLGVSYGEEEVRAQIEATRDRGIPDWIMWNASVRYTRTAFDADPPPIEEEWDSDDPDAGPDDDPLDDVDVERDDEDAVEAEG